MLAAVLCVLTVTYTHIILTHTILPRIIIKIIRWREIEKISGSRLLAPTCTYTHMHTHLYICAYV